MNDINALWRQRFKENAKEIRRYGRYILNDHLKYILIFFILIGAYYYQQFLEGLPENFNGAPFIAIVVAFFLTRGTVYTFFKHGDLVFLLPMEKRLSSYIRNSFWLTYMIQFYVLLIVVGVLAPLYLAMGNNTFKNVLFILLILTVVKGLNLFMTWAISRYPEKGIHVYSVVFRYILNALVSYFLFVDAHPLFWIATFFILLVLTVYFYSDTKKRPFYWEGLISLEEKRMMLFYRLANSFTDIPNVGDEPKRRRYLDVLVQFIPYKQNETYHHLYARTFLRAGGYLGLVIRLTFVGAFCLYFLPFTLGNIVTVLLFVYMTAIQLMPLWKHHHYKIWINLYPISETVKEATFLRFFFVILAGQAFALSVLLGVFHTPLAGILAFISSLIVFYLFTYQYVRAKMRKKR
ncbi:ABC transporter permease [Priestia filamentosa]|uniref:ABC transporter permease n=1 Tax=Priestia filamentosa TaxID=1402861 RepID=UPI001FB3FFC5|nr:ABC transporter permease [Priestia filamentosa]UOE60022.1 ABC transporter permease [Priestia filamentosa]